MGVVIFYLFLTDVSVASLALFWWDGYMWQRESSSRIDVAQESLIATPTQAGLWAVFVSLPPEGPRVYLPLVMKSWQTFDLAIVGMEVVQVTQTTDNRIPLITGKPIVLRVMVEVVPDKPFQDTYLQVEAFRKGVALAGSPLNIGPWTVFHSPSRDRFAHSFNLRLPDDWAQGDVTFRATVTSGSSVLEAQQNNNVREFVASFATMPPIDLKIVPITYVHTPTGQTVPAPTQYQVTDRILSIFPVDGVVLSEHVPMTYQGNLCESADWSNFLKAVTDLREAEGVPEAQVYYGLVSSADIYDI